VARGGCAYSWEVELDGKRFRRLFLVSFIRGRYSSGRSPSAGSLDWMNWRVVEWNKTVIEISTHS